MVSTKLSKTLETLEREVKTSFRPWVWFEDLLIKTRCAPRPQWVTPAAAVGDPGGVKNFSDGVRQPRRAIRRKICENKSKKPLRSRTVNDSESFGSITDYRAPDLIFKLNLFSRATMRLITIWLEVRVLPGPPRSLRFAEISRIRSKGPQLAGFRFGYRSLLSGTLSPARFSAVCLCAQIPVSRETESGSTETWFDTASTRREAEDVVLARPLGREISKTAYSHAVRQPALDGGFDKIGSEEGKRERQIHLADAASLAP
jgi:hypothetical protein